MMPPMDEQGSQTVRALQQVQRDRTEQTWAKLQKHGVTTSSLLALEAHFWSGTEDGAQRLARHLERRLAHSVTLRAIRRGFFRRSWAVDATRPARQTDLDDIGRWTDRMVEAAVKHDAKFDGWGTFVP